MLAMNLEQSVIASFSGFWVECFGCSNRGLNVAFPCFGVVVKSGHLAVFECVNAVGPLRQFIIIVPTCSCIPRSMVVGLLSDHICYLLDFLGVFNVLYAARVEIPLTGLCHSVVKPIGSDLQWHAPFLMQFNLDLIWYVLLPNPSIRLSLVAENVNKTQSLQLLGLVLHVCSLPLCSRPSVFLPYLQSMLIIFLLYRLSRPVLLLCFTSEQFKFWVADLAIWASPLFCSPLYQ